MSAGAFRGLSWSTPPPASRGLSRTVPPPKRLFSRGARSVTLTAGGRRLLPQIEAGGAFAALSRAVPTVELVDNRRQVEPWEREALAELRSGAVSVAIGYWLKAH